MITGYGSRTKNGMTLRMGIFGVDIWIMQYFYCRKGLYSFYHHNRIDIYIHGTNVMN